MSSSQIYVITGGILFFIMGFFHLRFYTIFKWKEEFQKIGVIKGKIHYTIHLALLLLFFGFSFLSVGFSDSLSQCEGLGLGIMIFLSLFWLWRTLWQIIYFKPPKNTKRPLTMHYIFIILFFLLFLSYTIPIILKLT